MKKNVFLLLSFSLLFSTICFSAGIFRTKPYLQNPTNNGITVSWLTNVPVYSWVEYGFAPDKLEYKAETIVDGQIMANNDKHHIRLMDLKPATRYYYRVNSREITLYEAYKKEFGETAVSEIYSFTTPPTTTKSSDFTAIIFNDLHKQKPVIDAFSKLIKDMDYQFIVFNGDVIDDPKDEEEAVSYLSYACEMLGAESAPLIFLRGNHEIRNAYSVRLRDLIQYVGGENSYGSFDWGDTRFVTLDCGEDKPDTTWVYYGLNNFESFRKDQVDFLKKELAGKSFKKAKKRVLIHHIPIYGGNVDKYNPCRELWHPLLSKAPFNICINGHTHRYQFLEKGEDSNNFPVVIGGGPRLESATLLILKKEGNDLTLIVKDTEGNDKK